MRSKSLRSAVIIAALVVVAAGISALAQDADSAQDETPTQFSGVINDYTPVSTTTAWEVRGPWSLKLNEDRGTGTFTAALTMEFSVLGQSPANVQAVSLKQHTHNIILKNATITYNPTDCPPTAPGTSPGYVARIEVNGTASVFGNGSAPAFGLDSPLQVCISGGTGTPSVAFSNITLAFQPPAANHFGGQAVRGVVVKTKRGDD